MRPVAALVLAFGLHPGGARAASSTLDQAALAYAELDYARVLPLVERALGESLSPAETIRAYELRAFVHTIEGRELEARDAYLAILERNPSYELAPSVSPKLRGPLELARAVHSPPVPDPRLAAPPVEDRVDIAQPAATTTVQTDQRPGFWSRPWFWAATAAVVATVVVVVVVASSGDGLPDHDYGPFRVEAATGGSAGPW